MTPTVTSTTAQGYYIQANELNIYYEEAGAGEPLILIHGSAGTCRAWDAFVPLLARHFRVITPDSRGHGRTDNPTAEFSYHRMAQDVAAFIQARQLNTPFVGGWSDGGQVALEVGMHYSHLIKGLLIGGAWFKFADTYVNGLKAVGITGPGAVDIERVEQQLAPLVEVLRAWHSPPHAPDYWKTLLVQLSTMLYTPLNYRREDFHRISVPVLVISADHDSFIPIEEAVEMYRLIPRAELAILPGSQHLLIMQRTSLFTTVVLDFLSRHGDPKA